MHSTKPPGAESADGFHGSDGARPDTAGPVASGTMSENAPSQRLTQWVATGSAVLHARVISQVRAGEIALEVERLNRDVADHAQVLQSIFDDPFQVLGVLEGLKGPGFE